MKPTKIVKELDKEQVIRQKVTITDYHKSPNNPVIPYDTEVTIVFYKRTHTPKDYHSWVKRYYKQYEDRKDWYYTRKYPKLVYKGSTDNKHIGISILGYKYKGQIHLTQVLDLFTSTEGTKVSTEKILKLLSPIQKEPVKRRRSISRGRI